MEAGDASDSTINPASEVVINSGLAVEFMTTAGVPHAIASTVTRPNVSSSDGLKNTSAAEYNCINSF